MFAGEPLNRRADDFNGIFIVILMGFYSDLMGFYSIS